ncbi:MAG: hypothetical protein KC502_16330 [Myxococcales bacterium]|nr:hypothetical protein [Myxococcales bacterium]
MTSETSTSLTQSQWAAGLRAKVDQWLAAHPLPTIEDAAALQRAMAEVQGGAFASFVQEQAPRLIAEREAAHRDPAQNDAAQDGNAGQGEDGELLPPLLIWITDEPGMIAAAAMIAPDAPQLIAAPREVFDPWMTEQPDWGCAHHVEHIGEFKAIDAPEVKHIEHVPNDLSGQWFEHRVGVAFGEDAGYETRHLWRWLADEFELIQPGYGGSLVY